MSTERVVSVGGGIDLAYEQRGDPGAPPVLLVMGLGAQLLSWPEGFCDALVARGLQVIRFDNRDVGRSTHLDAAPKPDLKAVMGGDRSSVSYTLSDMARDAVGLLDAIGLASAHLVGASMGAGIGQTMAIEHPARVRSLTSMMWTTGDPAVGQPRPEVLRAIFTGAPATTRDEVIEQQVRAARLVGSPRYAFDEVELRARAGRAWDRGHDPLGIARQAVATVASGDRTTKLRALAVPALVLHGADDPMCDVSGGRATAAAIAHAELLILDGMGHDLPRALWPEIVAKIAGLILRVEAR